jgi:hypothetical protein
LRQKIGFGGGVQVKEVGSYGDAEVLVASGGEGAEGEMSQGEVGGRVVGVGEPALVGESCWLGHRA